MFLRARDGSAPTPAQGSTTKPGGVGIAHALDAFKPLWELSKQHSGETALKALDLLGRPGSATQALLSGKGDISDFGRAGHALIHGVSPKEQDENLASIRHQIGLDDPNSFLGRTGTYRDAPQWQRGMVDAFLGTALDPTTPLGGSGVIQKGVRAVTSRALPFATAGKRIRGVAENFGVGRETTESAQNSVDMANYKLRDPLHIGAGIYDAFNYGGPAKRGLAHEYGREGAEKFAASVAPLHAQAEHAHEFERRYKDVFEKIREGLTPEQEMILYRAVHAGKIDHLKDPQLKAAAQAYQNMTRSIAYLQGSPQARKLLGETELVKLKPKRAKKYDEAAAQSEPTQSYFDFARNFKPQELEEMFGAIQRASVDRLPEHLQRPAMELDAIILRTGKGWKAEHNLTAVEDAVPGAERFRLRVKTPFQLPEYAKDFDKGVRGIQTSNKVRTKYVPQPHDFMDDKELKGPMAEKLRAYIESQKRKAGRKIDLADEANVNLKRRVGERRGLQNDPGLYRLTTEAMIENAANAITRHDMKKQVAAVFGKKTFDEIPPYMQDIFTVEYTPKSARSWMQKLGDAFKGLSELQKQALIAIGLRHEGNIGFLQLLSDPGAVPATLKRTVDLLRKSPEERYRSLRPSIEAGAITSFPDKKNPFIGIAEKAGLARAPIGAALGAYEGYQQDGLPGAVGYGAAGGLFGHFYPQLAKGSNKLLWTFDDAAKDVGTQRKVAAGMAPHMAGHEVQNNLINYKDRSPFTKAMAYAMPFATWGTKFPGSVLRMAAEHPERPLTIDRFSPALAGGTQPGDNGKSTKAYNPLAETIRGIEDPMDFARARLSWPLRGAASLANVGDTEHYPHFMSYGQDPLGKKFLATSLLGSFPGGDQFLGATGLNAFGDRGSAGVVRAQTGVGSVKTPVISEEAIRDYRKAHPRSSRAEAERALYLQLLK